MLGAEFLDVCFRNSESEGIAKVFGNGGNPLSLSSLIFYQFLLRASGVPTSQSKVREGVRKCVTVETCTVYPMISRTVNEGVASLWLVLSQIEQIMNEGVWLFDFPGASLSRKRK